MANDTPERPQVSAFAPATLSNLGPGFDCLGLAVAGIGDIVSVQMMSSPGVRIEAIHGDGGRLPFDPASNTAGVAARAVLAHAGRLDQGLALWIHKGLPLGSGLGSSGASAVAAAFATRALVCPELPDSALLDACMQGEAAASGSPHADNVAPALLGGIVLIRPAAPPETVRLPVPSDLWMGLVHPAIEVRTLDARRALPTHVTVADAVHQAAHLASLTSALYDGDLERLGRSVCDRIAEPARRRFIPGFEAAMEAARSAGALAGSISGSGPTLFALARGEAAAARAARAMADALGRAGIAARPWHAQVDPRGARLVDAPPASDVHAGQQGEEHVAGAMKHRASSD